MRFLKVRLREILGFEIISSVLCSILFYIGALKQTVSVCSLVMLLCIAVNIINLIVNLKWYCLFSRAKISEYYKTNLTAVLILAAITAVLAWFDTEPFFTWLFFPFKLLYIAFGMPKIVSALALCAVFAAVTACAPVFIKIRKS